MALCRQGSFPPTVTQQLRSKGMLGGDFPDAGSTVTVCSAVNPLAGCINIPINSDDCHSFTGGFSFLNDEVSAAIVPAGFVCTFFDAAGCLSTTDTDVVFLQGGTYNFLSVPGIFGNVNFNDRASSFTCSTF
ncbi:hypothetical protein C8J57DRAFT_1221052 [Mycena rebaudengoi]|nr:hypothetical protein C8J57DRAFT_1221052 [Mycena rebaudengoi]